MDEITSVQKFKEVIHTEFPYSIEQSERVSEAIALDTIIEIPALHTSAPQYDTVLQEVKGLFTLDSILGAWYAYRCKSKVDTSTAFLIIPGTGYHQGWLIATADTNNYHNILMPIRNKCLEHGDVYVYVKPNEDFRVMWKSVWGWNSKMDYDVLGPYSDYQGINWAANMVIEATAAVKTLRKKYNKVIVMGLSNGGFPALIAGIQGEAHGTVLACGLTIADYEGFPVPNNENPLYYRMHKKYSIDTVKHYLGSSNNYYLFGFGDNDFWASEEYQYKRLEDTLNSTGNKCHIDFTYNYTGHHYPIAYLDTFINKVKIDTCAPIIVTYTEDVKHKANLIAVYPNPTNNVLNIELNGDRLLYIQVFNLNGQELRRINIMAKSNPSISLNGYSTGNYLINVVGEKSRNCVLVSKVD